MKSFSICAVLMLCCLCIVLPNACSQTEQNVLHTINSSVFEAERKVHVFLPERYFRDSTTNFIVTYMLDAQDDQVWNMAKSNIDYMVSRYTVIPMIVVGVISPDRGSEFNPNSDLLQRHLKEEVFPLIRKNYRIEDFNTIIGHSWGGAFVGKILFSDASNLFDAYIGVSPSLDANNNVIHEAADSLLRENKVFKKFFFFSSGNVGFEKEYDLDVKKMDSLLSKYPKKDLAWESKLYEGKDHFSAVIPAINDGLTSMSRNYFADQKTIEDFALNEDLSVKEQLDLFYTQREALFGYSFYPSSLYLKFVADELGENSFKKAAIEVYHIGLERDPKNYKLIFNLANTYDQMGEVESAKKYFIEALAYLEVDKSAVSERYYANIKKWANDKLETYKK